MSTKTIEVARGDVRLLVLAAGYCLGVLNDLPEDDREQSECEASLVADLADAGVVVEDEYGAICWAEFAAAVKRCRECILDEDGDDVQPGPTAPK